jgi:aspartate/methionine/tyrosine aminotransferase
MERADELRQRALSIARSGVDQVDAWVRAAGGVDWAAPQGPGFGCVLLPPGTDDVALAVRLHDEFGVLVVPGSLLEVPGSLRLTWLQVGDRLSEGLERLTAALQQRA